MDEDVKCMKERKNTMRKKIALLSLTVLMGLSVVACGTSKGGEADSTTTPTATPDATKIMNVDLSGYITLGDYKGIEVKAEDATVTDKEVEEKIQSTLEGKATYEDVDNTYAAKDGDKLNIDFTGYVDDKAFDNGSATEQDVQIGAGKFIPGFEEGLVGHKEGEEFDINVTFPEDYSSTDLAGKDAKFTIKIHTIQKQVVPELTDEYVAKLSTTSKTVADYKAEVRKSLEADKLAAKKETEQNNVWSTAVANAEVSEYPQDQVDYYKSMLTSQFEYYATQYGVDLETYVGYLNVTMDEFNEKMDTNAKAYVKELMFMQKLAQVENLTVTDEEYQKALQEYLDNYELKDEAELIKSVGETAPIQIKQNCLYNKVMDFLYTNAVIK